MSDGIRIPKIETVQSPAPQSVGRLEVSPQLPQNPQMQVAGSLLGEAGDYFVKQEEFAADTKADEIANKYHQDLVTRYSKMKESVEGDPTEFYKTFNSDTENKRNEFMSGEYSNLTKSKIVQKLKNVDNKFYDKVETWYAKASDDYKAVTEKSTLERFKSEMQGDASIVSADPASYGPLEQTMAEMEEKIRVRGLEIGTIKVDENGNYIWSNPAKQRLARYRAEGLYGVIENLSVAGQPEKAAAIYEKYQDYLDEYNKPKYEAKIKTGLMDKQASSMINQWSSSMTPDKIQSMIDKVDNPELKSKLEDKFTVHLNKESSRKRNLSNLTFDKVSNLIRERMSGSTPYTTDKEMQSDPLIAGMWDRLDPEDKDKAVKMVVRPSTSNTEQRRNISEYYTAHNGFAGVSRIEFERMAAGLAPVDYNRYNRIYEQDNREGATGVTARKDMLAYAKKTMDQAGMIKIKEGGKLSTSDKELLSAVESKLIESFEATGEMKPYSKESRSHVDKLINDVKKDRSILTRPSAPKMNSKPEQQSGVMTTGNLAVTMKAKQAFFSKYTRWPKTADEIKEATNLVGGK